jgi:hypothetical protein
MESSISVCEGGQIHRGEDENDTPGHKTSGAGSTTREQHVHIDGTPTPTNAEHVRRK